MYNERFLERRQPGLVTFSRLRGNLLKYGSFNKPNRNRNGDENLENLVLQSVVENPRTSLRQIEANVEVSKTTAQRVLKKFKYRPYHEHISQGLREGDLDRRSVFCNWFHHQTRWGFNVWMGILYGHVLFHIFNDNLTGPRYL